MYPLKISSILATKVFVHDSSGNGITTLVDGDFTKRFSKGGGAWAAMTVTLTHEEAGWYAITISASHSDTLGVLTIYFTAAGAMQANLQFRVFDTLTDDITGAVFPAGAIDFTYTVTSNSTGLPIEGVEVWISTDNPAVNIVWRGDTDAFGVARDIYGNLPALDVGVYFFWRQKAGFTFVDPDTENVS